MLVKCSVCSKQDAVYRCPQCDCRTCSLPCVTKHKTMTGCHGGRLSTRYLSKSQLTKDVILQDVEFLDSIPLLPNQCNEQAAVNANDGHKLKMACRQRNITLLTMPATFSKHRENKSLVVDDSITWTVRFGQDLLQINENDVLIDRFGEHIQIKVERPTKHIDIATTDSLKSVLFGQTVIEYPEIIAIHHH